LSETSWPKAEDVRRRINGQWQRVYKALLPDRTIHGRGPWRQVCCPFHDDHKPSFAFNVDHGGWRCHAGCGSGDVFSFIQRLENCSFPEAVRRVAQIGGAR